MSSLQKAKDPILLELETICTSRLAMPVKFMHANLNEANFGLDQLTADNFPVLVHVSTAKDKNKIGPGGDIERTASMFCLLLNRIEQDTSDFKSYDLNNSINQMRMLGENLMYWINRSTISVAGGVDDWESENVYQKFDAHLFGVALTFDWTVDSQTSGYYNSAP